MDESFARHHRLRQRREFLLVYGEGSKAHGRLAVIFRRRRGDAGPWRLGITATRRLGKAVVRNRLRRRIREIFRRRHPRPPDGWDFVVNLKHPAVEASYEELLREIDRLLARLEPHHPAPPAPESSVK